MKQIKTSYFGLIYAVIFFAVGCNKATDYKKYLDGHEIVYPGTVNNLKAVGGNNRALLYWNPSPDPSITRYTIYWNNKLDSLNISATTNNPNSIEKVIVSGLSELSIYNFIIYSFDSSGNKSIPKTINNVRIYGAFYAATLKNRSYASFIHSTITAYDTINWNTPDTININTSIRYTNTSNVVTSINIAPTDKMCRLVNYKAGTYVYYKSSYIPISNSPDTFYVAKFDSLRLAQ